MQGVDSDIADFTFSYIFYMNIIVSVVEYKPLKVMRIVTELN